MHDSGGAPSSTPVTGVPSAALTNAPSAAPSCDQSIQDSAMCDLAAALNGQISSWTCTGDAPNDHSSWKGLTVSNGVVNKIKINYYGVSGTMISFIFGLLTPISFNITLAGTIPSTIGYLTGLSRLDFDGNSIAGTIDFCFLQLTHTSF